jgi:hypothetical protein
MSTAASTFTRDDSRTTAKGREGIMLSQIATVSADAAVVCEMLLGAALLLLWVAVELIGYGGLLFYTARSQRWFVELTRSKPARDDRWGTTVRAAGLRSRRLQPS